MFFCACRLVVAGQVDGELPQEFAGGGVNDRDVEFLNQECDVGSGVGSPHADVAQLAGESEGDGAGIVDTAGDVVFVPKNVFHGLENASDIEPVVTLWGYSGGASLEQAGYVLPRDEA